MWSGLIYSRRQGLVCEGGGERVGTRDKVVFGILISCVTIKSFFLWVRYRLQIIRVCDAT